MASEVMDVEELIDLAGGQCANLSEPSEVDVTHLAANADLLVTVPDNWQIAIYCPKCGRDTRVTSTRGNRRYRKCMSCHNSYSTIEVLQHDADVLMKVSREAAQLLVACSEEADPAPQGDWDFLKEVSEDG